MKLLFPLALAVIFAILYFIPRTLIDRRIARQNEWRNRPNLQEYLEENPKCRTGRGVTCKYCGSYNIINRGMEVRHDSKRIHTCRTCSTNLYRTEFYE